MLFTMRTKLEPEVDDAAFPIAQTHQDIMSHPSLGYKMEFQLLDSTTGKLMTYAATGSRLSLAEQNQIAADDIEYLKELRSSINTFLHEIGAE